MMMTCTPPGITIAFFVLCMTTRRLASAFIEPHSRFHVRSTTAFAQSISRTSLETSSPDLQLGDDSLEVVLFGVGDLRTDDHEGLKNALERASKLDSRVLLLVVLDEESLSNIPGAVAHTFDTASMLAEALVNLQGSLQEKNLALHVAGGGCKTMSESLSQVLEPYFLSTTKVSLHVCDHGDADNSMGYSPLANLNSLPGGMEVQPWSCSLWEDAWTNAKSLPGAYPEFAKEYSSEPSKPVSKSGASDVGLELEAFLELPTADKLCSAMQNAMGLDPEKCLAETNSGLFATHWGGLDPSTVGESKVLENVRAYVEECEEDDEAFAKQVPLACTRNPKSLEHAAMAWNLRGDGTKETPETSNLIAGEQLTRYLMAPLFLGTVSPRRLWHSVRSTPPLYANTVRTLVETREWHKLFAARNLRSTTQNEEKGALSYKYWRWHGFLCRYGETEATKENSSSEKEGVLLVHGFGASGNQLEKSIKALSNGLDANSNVQCMAPDLIGFGQSEKPPITYLGFTWEAYMGDFIKEIACAKNQWNSFVVGGNSIGGFVSICAAANDATVDKEAVSGCGAPGSGKCTGAILMNPAGVIQSKENVEQMEQVAEKSQLKSVAQVTVMDELPPCKPIPRPVARAFGNGLLAYLRPRIAEICVNLYPANPDAVDSKLCGNILRDSQDPGAINVMISGSKLPTPRTYNEVIAADFGQSQSTTDDKGNSIKESQFKGPILMAQGILDPLNDAKGRAEQLQTLRKGITITPLPGGHCPHDEVPEAMAASISEWMKETEAERMEMVQDQRQRQSIASQ